MICIPLAAGLFSYKMNPMVGAAAMSLSSFTVCMNALRLNLYNIYNPNRDKKIKNNKINKENNIMEKIIKVEGMSCSHCEARVSDALKKIDGVNEAVADHSQNQVKLTLSKEVDENILKDAVTNAGYDYKGLV